MSRQLVFRFDVDTHRCLTRGTPALRAFVSRAGIAATFFVNMGRATSRRRLIVNTVDRVRHTDAISPARIERLSAMNKLGVADALRVAIANPYVGRAHRKELARLRDDGHEVGLHGGRNHRAWQDEATRWQRARVADEVRWGLRQLRHTIAEPVGFASPAWEQPGDLPSVAYESGIAYLADVHGHAFDGLVWEGALPTVATNLVGEPGGVGFLEWHRARGHDDKTIVADFCARLEQIQDLAVLYDHPFWAGVHDLDMVATLARHALDAGIEVVTLGQAVRDRLASDRRTAW